MNEEHTLFERGERQALTEQERARLQDVQVCLDQLWDLLRRRRALRRVGADPDSAKLRDAAVVEHYEQ